MELRKLRYQGAFLQVQVDNKLNGLLFDNNGNFKRNWNFPDDMFISENYIVAEHQNGTISVAIKVDNHSWMTINTPLEEPVFYGKKTFQSVYS